MAYLVILQQLLWILQIFTQIQQQNMLGKVLKKNLNSLAFAIDAQTIALLILAE